MILKGTAHPGITFLSGSTELLDAIRPLWENLNKHHVSISPHFKQDFDSYTFEQRTAKLLKKHEKNLIRIEIAQINLQPIGYVVCSFCENRVGEIESIYVDEKFRGQGVGEKLMEQALTWLDNLNTKAKIINVAVGNEAAYRFYSRFGFYPRVVTLRQKDS